MNTIIKTKASTRLLTPIDNNAYTDKNTDTDTTVTLGTTITSAGGHYDSYIAEITKYSNAAGRADMTAVPENLTYVHSDDTDITLKTYYKKDSNGVITIYKQENNKWYSKECNSDSNFTEVTDSSKLNDLIPYNEEDEFWGESVVISKPTGQDKLTPVQIIVISTAAVAIIGVGAILIKKFAIKK
jgi:hypothetical protein